MNTAYVVGALFVIAGIVTFAIFLMFGALGDRITKKMDEVAMRLIDERKQLEQNRYSPEGLRRQTAELRAFAHEVIGNPDFGSDSRLAGAVVLMEAYHEVLHLAAHAYKNAAAEQAAAEDDMTKATFNDRDARAKRLETIRRVVDDISQQLRDLSELYRDAADEVERLRSLAVQ